MAGNKNKKANPPYEEASSSPGVPFKILIAMLCFGIAVLIIYLAFAEPQAGTAMQSVRDIIRGISGDVPIVLALIFLWIGILCIGSAGGKGVKTFHIIAYSIMFLSIFSAVHVFSAETIIAQLNVRSFAQFIITSFQKQIGGGLLGSFMAYFLYEYVGSYAGCGVCVMLILLALVATGRASKIFNWGKSHAEQSKRIRDERAAKRAYENNHLFDEFEESGEQRRRQPQNVKRGNMGTPEQMARRRQANKHMERVSNPHRKEVYIPNKGDPTQERLQEVTQAFYAPEKDEDVSKRRKSKVNGGIEVPSPMRDLREKHGDRSRGAKSRFANPESKRRPPRKEGDASEGVNGDISSVSSDVMAVVAQETKKQSAASSAENERRDQAKAEALQERNDDTFANITEDIQEEENEKFEPVSYQPAPQPKKRVEEGTRGLFEGSISRSVGKEKHEKPVANFKETDDPEYNYPPIDLLERGDKEDLVRQHEAHDREKAAKLIETLESFGITTTLTGIAHGPAVTRFELQPNAGIKVSRITSLADDIALALAAESVRIEAPIPGKPAVGVEIPNEKVEMVRLRDVLESNEALHNNSKIAVGLGKDNSGRYVVADIAKMPHVLIAGQTGSGKSVCINSIITSILYRATPEDVRMILIDPKVVELSIYNDIPHLIAPVVTDPKKAASALQWAVSEMLDRYKKFSAKGVRNIKGYNSALTKDEKKMPQMVIIIDELADLMMAAPGEVEDSICRIAQLARAAGMHLVIATQRPSTNVITGIIKANIPTRIAFAVASQIDSRVMIDYGGAEKLLGNGDMLFVPNGGKSLRVQGTWVSDAEVESVVSYIKERCDTNYDEDVQEKIENSVKSDAEIEDSNAELDDRLAEAVEIVVEAGQASVSMLQRRMRVGYARAGRLIDEMQKRGIVSEADGAKPRNVLMTKEQFRQTFGEDI